MSESNVDKEKKPVKLKEVAEETGELIGKGVKKTWSVIQSFGKGFAETVEGKEEHKAITTCYHCLTSAPTNSKFCPNCGKEL